MKKVVISADGDRKVYFVPDAVADNLEKYCMEFCTIWLWKSLHAKNIELMDFYAITRITLLNI